MKNTLHFFSILLLVSINIALVLFIVKNRSVLSSYVSDSYFANVKGQTGTFPPDQDNQIEVNENIIIRIDEEKRLLDTASIKLIKNQNGYVFDEILFENWLAENYDFLKLQKKESPYIKFDQDNKSITFCRTGVMSYQLPKESISFHLSYDYSQISKLKFQAQLADLTQEDIQTNQKCQKIREYFSEILHSDILKEGDLSSFLQYFHIFFDENENLEVILKDERGLLNFLVEIKDKIDTKEKLPPMRVYHNQYFLIGLFQKAKTLDILQTIEDAKQQGSQKFRLNFKYSEIPKQINGLNVAYYPVEVGKGIAKFPLSSRAQWYSDTVQNTIKKGIQKLDGQIITPNQEFSLINALDAQIMRFDRNSWKLVPTKRGAQNYGIGVCGVSTVMFRLALESGLPIIERHGHKQAIQNYMYPYDSLVDSAVFLYDELKQDLKFKNDYPFNLLIVSDVWYEQDELYYQVRFFAPEGSTSRNVRLDNFFQEEHTKGHGFKESFVRYTDSSEPEYFEMQYYLSDF